jgi:uroporphyrinogen decarboxylase
MNLDSQLMPSSIVSSQANSLFLKALRGGNHAGRPPVWLMRQAGRYLPEYQKMRESSSIEEIFRDPEKLAEVTLQPLRRFPLDAAILFADILHILLPLGCEVSYPAGGPQVKVPSQLEQKEVSSVLHFVQEGISLLKEQLDRPLIGFCGGPYTVAHYLFGKKPEKVLYQDPKYFKMVLDQITLASQAYLDMQIRAGVDVIQIFDSWAGTLPKEELKEFSLPYLKRLIDSVEVPVLVFSRGSSFYLDEFVSLGADGISFDGMRPLSEIRKEVPTSMAVQGNLPPESLYGSISSIQKRTQALLLSMKGEAGFIVNLGHGVLPDTPVEHVQAFIETVVTSGPLGA